MKLNKNQEYLEKYRQEREQKRNSSNKLNKSNSFENLTKNSALFKNNSFNKM